MMQKTDIDHLHPVIGFTITHICEIQLKLHMQ